MGGGAAGPERGARSLEALVAAGVRKLPEAAPREQRREAEQAHPRDPGERRERPSSPQKFLERGAPGLWGREVVKDP